MIIVAHGGVGSRKALADGPLKAAKKSGAVLKNGGSALDAAVAGVMALEDDPRFNAGTGSVLRFDGTVQMDAAVMDSENNYGAVACIQRVKNPVLVARKVMDSPHRLICGDGATQFARVQNFPPYNPITPKAIANLKRVKSRIAAGKIPGWIKRFRKEPWRSMVGCDTVGMVVSDGKGNFAAAGSTGGTSYMLPGRIGDTPLIGCGIYAGKKGAVVATGVGEEIIKRMLSKEVYEKINRGLSPQQACEWGLTLFERTVPIGVIAVTLNNYGIAASHQMASAILKK
ncbi:MAG: isoaspartyl peptidase/L-asparaginase [Planctomycetes bacterium]|nr:isoaspartyl peptidase/L-asparaginase [Planctomycetota bacterium]